MDKLIFKCASLEMDTTTNECYDCNKYLTCELFINKLYEEDDINNDSDAVYDDIKILTKIDNSENNENDRDPRWWMN